MKNNDGMPDKRARENCEMEARLFWAQHLLDSNSNGEEDEETSESELKKPLLGKQTFFVNCKRCCNQQIFCDCLCHMHPPSH